MTSSTEVCCICLEGFHEEVVVLHEVARVQHAVCHTCAKELRKGSGGEKIPCPICRHKVIVPRVIEVWCSMCKEREGVMPEKKAKWSMMTCKLPTCRPNPENVTCMTCFRRNSLHLALTCHYCGVKREPSPCMW